MAEHYILSLDQDYFSKNHLKFKLSSLFIYFLYIYPLYTTNFTEPLSYQGSAFLKLPKFP